MKKVDIKKFKIEINNNGKCAILECEIFNNCLNIPCYTANIKELLSNFKIREYDNIQGYFTPMEEIHYKTDYTQSIPNDLEGDLKFWIISKMKEIYGHDSNVDVEEVHKIK
jgi:hypothetical protein